LRPGDTVVVTKRGNSATLSTFGGDAIAFSHVTILGN